MLLLMLERDMPIDLVLNADTGMEFPEMYEHLKQVDEHLYRERGIHITRLKSPKSFEYIMFDEPKQKASCISNRQRLGVPCKGNGWPGIRVRWCTGQLKTHLISREVNRLRRDRPCVQYIGFAIGGAQSVNHGDSEALSLTGDWSIGAGSTMPLDYDANVSATSVGIDEQVLSVVFVVEEVT